MPPAQNASMYGVPSPQVLLLSMNQLATLPPEIAALTALTHLDVSLNSITRLMSGQLPPRLVRLNMQVSPTP